MTAFGTPSRPIDPATSTAAATQWVKYLAAELGFDLVGVAPAGRFAHADAFLNWLQAGRAGTMQYMHRSIEERTDPTKLLEGARSVIAVACSYQTRDERQDAVVPTPVPDRAGEDQAIGDVHQGSQDGAAKTPESRGGRGGEAMPRAGLIARYALGEDYHEVMKPRLHALADAIRCQFPGEQTKCCVDTTPILEREAAALAGLGWIGKNNCLINREWGSWLVLGEVVTTLALDFDSATANFCGTCTRCIDACPTGALTAARELDARKCIAYLTLEHREPLVGQERQQIGNWLAGCDLCQDCCPWNRRARLSPHAEFNSRFVAGRIDLQTVLNWSEEEYRQATRGSAVRRVKLPAMKDRAEAIIANGRAEG